MCICEFSGTGFRRSVGFDTGRSSWATSGNQNARLLCEWSEKYVLKQKNGENCATGVIAVPYLSEIQYSNLNECEVRQNEYGYAFCLLMAGVVGPHSPGGSIPVARQRTPSHYNVTINAFLGNYNDAKCRPSSATTLLRGESPLYPRPHRDALPQTSHPRLFIVTGSILPSYSLPASVRRHCSLSPCQTSLLRRPPLLGRPSLEYIYPLSYSFFIISVSEISLPSNAPTTIDDNGPVLPKISPWIACS